MCREAGGVLAHRPPPPSSWRPRFHPCWNTGGAGDGSGDVEEEEGAEAGRMGTERRGVAGVRGLGGIVRVDTGRRSWWSCRRWGWEDWRWRVVARGGGPVGELRARWGGWGGMKGVGRRAGAVWGRTGAGVRWGRRRRGGGGWGRRSRALFCRRGSIPVVTGFGCGGVISVDWGSGRDARQPNTGTVVVMTVAACHPRVSRPRGPCRVQIPRATHALRSVRSWSGQIPGLVRARRGWAPRRVQLNSTWRVSGPSPLSFNSTWRVSGPSPLSFNSTWRVSGPPPRVQLPRLGRGFPPRTLRFPGLVRVKR